MLEFLRKEGIRESLISEIEYFHKYFTTDPAMQYRVPRPRFRYYGTEIWEMAITALLCGENLLLVGPKATGKNVLSENLGSVFGRPQWNISFHVNTDSASLIGSDTFENGQVVMRHGPVYECAMYGGFGVLDEINMAKNEAIALLHATLDFRRIIDIPGYNKITLNGATRFIATMNYGYAGTRELNEALASRFMVIEMPGITPENLRKLFTQEFPHLKQEYMEQFIGLFQDLQKKCENSEISTKSVDLRGILAAIHLMNKGLEPINALRMGITNKSFDIFEREIVEDVIRLRIPARVGKDQIFSK